jgi:hypothetical protein
VGCSAARDAVACRRFSPGASNVKKSAAAVSE